MFHLLIEVLMLPLSIILGDFLFFFERVFYNSGEDRRQCINQVPYRSVGTTLQRVHNAWQVLDTFKALGKPRYG